MNFDNLFIYCFVGIFLLGISFIVACKIMFPFWSVLPIFHTYDFYRYLYWKPGIVSRTQGRPNAIYYLKRSEAETVAWLSMKDETKKRAHALIQEWYGTTPDSFQSIELPHLDCILSNTESHSWITLLSTTVPQYDSSTGWTSNTTYSACVASHMYRMLLQDGRDSIQYNIYYLDFLSIPKSDKRVETLLYTHLWNQQHESQSEILITLFKKEGEPLRGCRPFLQYKTWYCNIQNACEYHGNIPIQITIVDEVEQLRHVYEYLTAVSSLYKIMIYNSLSYIWKQLTERHWFIGILWGIGVNNKEPLAYYFFTRDWIEWSVYGNGHSLQLVHCQTVQAMDDELLFRGFNQILRSITAKNTEFTLLKIDEFGENTRLLPFVQSNYFHSNSLYFNNLIYPARLVLPRDCFILL